VIETSSAFWALGYRRVWR